MAKRIAALLRLAVLLNRDRTANMNALPELTAEGQQLNLKFNNQWIAKHPLTAAYLSQERNRLTLIGIKFNFS